MGFKDSVVFPWPPGYIANAATSVESYVSLQSYGLEENYVFDPSIKSFEKHRNRNQVCVKDVTFS